MKLVSTAIVTTNKMAASQLAEACGIHGSLVTVLWYLCPEEEDWSITVETSRWLNLISRYWRSKSNSHSEIQRLDLINVWGTAVTAVYLYTTYIQLSWLLCQHKHWDVLYKHNFFWCSVPELPLYKFYNGQCTFSSDLSAQSYIYSLGVVRIIFISQL